MSEQANEAPDISKLISQYDLPERYSIEYILGRGGMGTVFAAIDLQLERKVAIKVQSQNSESPVAAERFLRETKVLARLDHPNIVKILNSGVTKLGALFYVMEFIEGRSLQSMLNDGPLEFTLFQNVMSDLINGLIAIHEQQLIHRDLKPSNVMICIHSNLPATAKIIDFGIVRFAAPDPEGLSITKTQALLGSPRYMSPEQCTGKELSRASDIYALGCIMYECVTGHPPFSGATDAEIMYKHVSETPAPLNLARNKNSARLSELIMNCLSKKPEQRPGSLEQLKAVLQTAKATDILPPEKSSKKRSPLAIFLSCALIAALGILAFKTYYQHTHPDIEKAKPNSVKLSSVTPEGNIRRMLKQEGEIGDAAGDQERLQNFLEITNRIYPTIKSKAWRFCALQLKARLYTRLHKSSDECIELQKEAASIYPAGTGPTNNAIESLAELYESRADINGLKHCLKLLQAPLTDVDESEHIEPDVWSPSGSGVDVWRPALRAHIECMEKKFDLAEKHFEEAENEERSRQHYNEELNLIRHQLSLYERYGHTPLNLARLHDLETALANAQPKEYADIKVSNVFETLEQVAESYHDRDLAIQCRKDAQKLQHEISESLKSETIHSKIQKLIP